jgi:hypothetical protein
MQLQKVVQHRFYLKKGLAMLKQNKDSTDPLHACKRATIALFFKDTVWTQTGQLTRFLVFLAI